MVLLCRKSLVVSGLRECVWFQMVSLRKTISRKSLISKGIALPILFYSYLLYKVYIYYIGGAVIYTIYDSQTPVKQLRFTKNNLKTILRAVRY